mmetsp:Transcript_79391/g.202220  ORF Transcript_79391/g.202220 Transcript_79391/m.202220 type:complete len:445 (+) Transcript_79391:416-1750(+)
MDAQGPAAVGGVVEVQLRGIPGEDLDRAQEATIAQACIHVVVLQVYGAVGRRSQGRDVGLQPPGHDHGIGVHLDRPVEVRELPSLVHLLPDVDEDVGVRQRGLAGVPGTAGRLPRVEDVGGVTSEDAGLVSLGQVHQRHLLGVRQHRHEAVQRRASHCLVLARGRDLVLGAARTHIVAPPARGQRHLLREPSCLLHGLNATSVGVIPLQAGEADVAAQLVLRAVLTGPGTTCGQEGAIAQRLATPILGLVALLVANVHASGIVLVLLEASLAARAPLRAAAAAPGAVLTVGRARVQSASRRLTLGLGPGTSEFMRANGLVPEAMARRLALALVEHALRVLAALILREERPACVLALRAGPSAPVVLPANVPAEGPATRLALFVLPHALRVGMARLFRPEGVASLHARALPHALVAGAAARLIAKGVARRQARIVLPHAAPLRAV